MSEATPNYSPGLEGINAGISTISQIDSDRSSLTYRGIDVHELAEHATFEETVYLLLMGKLPNATELAAFKKLMGEERAVPGAVYDAIRGLPAGTHPMDMARVGFSVLPPFDADYNAGAIDHDANVRKAVRIVAKASTIVGNGYRILKGEPVVETNPDDSVAENFLRILGGGQQPDEYTAKVMDTSLILYAEHGFNASTFACRVTVSTLSDVYSGIISGIGTLKGPLHGGANEEAMKMLIEIDTPDKAEAWVRDALATKKKIMGFGHREYKKGDSRAFYMSKQAKEIGERMGNTRWGQIADTLERVMLEEKNLFPNVDFPAAYAYYLLGIPIDLYTPIFVIARTAGWSAHAVEQLDGNRLIRPTCIYQGPVHTPFVGLADR